MFHVQPFKRTYLRQKAAAVSKRFGFGVYVVKIEWLSPTHSLDVGELLHELLCGSMLVFDESCCLMLVSDFAGKLVERISGPTLWNLGEALLYLDAVLLALRNVPLLQHRQSKCHGCCVEVLHPP